MMRTLTAENFLETREEQSFSNASVFGALSEESILWLLENGKIQSLEAGELLFDQGQPGNSFHVILQGTVSYHKYHEGRYAYIRDYQSGQQIGFVSLIALHDRVGRAECHEGTIAVEIDSKLFDRFHRQYPLEFGILTLNLAREMARTLRSVDNQMVEKASESEE